ncbi:prepilin-type N-terminal cleavage/methylation domain-containing protein [Paraglaciecola sp. 2405UD69-4]|uniref:prepilin-type N-terminal cleavage/methylation domain-containing protein n=1 Tax=Paraglaciecola sp. 2405UD69-4 TaxID=3391836 RepID=UPI0039C92A5D
MTTSELKPKSSNQGFTLIELIIVILIVSVLAISVFVRFNGNTGFAEYTYQARLISSLRNLQNRALFDTRENYCFQINFDLALPAFGPPTLNYTNGNGSDTCETSIDFNNPDYLTTTALEMSENDISLTTVGDNNTSFSLLRFDSYGRPFSDSTTCLNTCKITLTGEATISVCIESEGYIHACE